MDNIINCSHIFHNKEFEEWLENWVDNFSAPQDKEHLKNMIVEWKKEWKYNEEQGE